MTKPTRLWRRESDTHPALLFTSCGALDTGLSLSWSQSPSFQKEGRDCGCFSSTHTKIGSIQRRLAWPLHQEGHDLGDLSVPSILTSSWAAGQWKLLVSPPRSSEACLRIWGDPTGGAAALLWNSLPPPPGRWVMGSAGPWRTEHKG